MRSEKDFQNVVDDFQKFEQ